MSNVKLPGSNRFDSEMQIHTGNKKYYVILAKKFQHQMIKEHRKHDMSDQGGGGLFTERKWTYIQYHVQDNADVAYQDVRLYCNKNKFP